MKEGVGFLVANKVSDTCIRPEGGIRQGGPLAPALYVIITAVLFIMLHGLLPTAVRLLYADGAPPWGEWEGSKGQKYIFQAGVGFYEAMSWGHLFPHCFCGVQNGPGVVT